MNKDTLSTFAGGALGFNMLTTINYSVLPQPWGELAKVVVGFGLILAGYLMYREKPKADQSTVAILDNPVQKAQ